MRRLSLLSLAVLSGCGSGDPPVGDGPFALAFTGDDCVIAEGPLAALGTELTIEAWVRGDAAPVDPYAAIVTVGGAAMLYVDDDRTGVGDDETPDVGQETELTIWDGRRHHLAATWTPDGGTIFVDGYRSGHGEAWTSAPGTDEIRLGCAADGAMGFDGVIDEVRVSTTVRYERNFQVEAAPLADDDATIALWHLDDGAGDIASDSAGAFPAEIGTATWIGGLLDE